MNAPLNWIRIAGSLPEVPFGANNLAQVSAGERDVCIGRWKEELFAFAPKCPHAGGPFKDGFIDALGNVVCPLHKYKFCMKNGYNITGEGYHLKYFPVRLEEGGVFVGLPAGTAGIL